MRYNTGPGSRTPKERNKRRRPLPGNRGPQKGGLLGIEFGDTFSAARHAQLLLVQDMTPKDMLEDFLRLVFAHSLAAESEHRAHPLEMTFMELNRVMGMTGPLVLRIVKSLKEDFKDREMDGIQAEVMEGAHSVEVDEDGTVSVLPLAADGEA